MLIFIEKKVFFFFNTQYDSWCVEAPRVLALGCIIIDNISSFIHLVIYKPDRVVVCYQSGLMMPLPMQLLTSEYR